MKIDAIWNELENDHSLPAGLLLRRYAPTVLPDIYVAMRQPEKSRCIALRLHSEDIVNLSGYDPLKDVRLEIIPDERNNAQKYLLILLSSRQHQDVFAILCEDLILGISTIIQKDIIVKELLNRLEKWKSLFDKAAAEGLTPEEQRGLFGELYFLRKWIMHSSDIQRCVFSWPEMELRDFQYSDWAVEVKTTYGNNHQRIHVSSERQLDPTTLKNLFLYHLSLEVQNENGETLNQIIHSIFELLGDDLIVQARFKSRLLQGGYFTHHKALYDSTGYHIRQGTFYNVRGDFPRLEEKDLRAGVGEVKYSIILSNFTGYIVSESSVFENISNYA